MLGGVGIGAASILTPMYIAEIAPTLICGRLVTLYQLGIVLGIFSAVLVNMLIQHAGDDAWNTAIGWKWMFFSGVLPAVVFGGVILLAAESPRWLMKVGRRAEALAVLTRINGSAIAENEARSIQTSLTEEEGKFSELHECSGRRCGAGRRITQATERQRGCGYQSGFHYSLLPQFRQGYSDIWPRGGVNNVSISDTKR